MKNLIEKICFEIQKASIAIIPAGYFILSDKMAEAVFTLGFAVVLDTATGWVRSSGWFCGGFDSHKMFNFKKYICYVIAILLGYCLTKLPYMPDTFIYVCAWLSLREAWSVMENLADMGLEFPQQIVKKVSGQMRGCKIPNIK